MTKQTYPSRHTTEKCISVIRMDIQKNLKDDMNNCSALSLALDEFTNIQDKPQPAIFIQCVSNDVDAKKRLIGPKCTKGTRGTDIIKTALEISFQEVCVYQLRSKLNNSTDCAPATRGTDTQLIRLLKNYKVFPDFLPVQCITQNLTDKYFR